MKKNILQFRMPQVQTYHRRSDIGIANVTVKRCSKSNLSLVGSTILVGISQHLDLTFVSGVLYQITGVMHSNAALKVVSLGGSLMKLHEMSILPLTFCGQTCHTK